MKYRLVAIIASTHSLDGGGKALFGYKDAKGNSKFQTRYFRRRPTKRAPDLGQAVVVKDNQPVAPSG